MCTVLDLPNPLIIPPNYHMPNSVRWVLVPTTWVRHSDPHVAERKMGVPEKWPILAKVQVLPFARAKIQMPPPHTFEGTLAVRFCNSSSHQLGGGEVSVPSAAAVRVSSCALSTWEGLSSIWCWASVILCHLGPLLGPPPLVLRGTRCLTYPAETDVQSRAA